MGNIPDSTCGIPQTPLEKVRNQDQQNANLRHWTQPLIQETAQLQGEVGLPSQLEVLKAAEWLSEPSLSRGVGTGVSLRGSCSLPGIQKNMKGSQVLLGI